MKTIVAPLAAVVLLTGCAGYTTKFKLPAHLATFSVETAVNKTLERNLDMEFTQALIREVQAKTDLEMARPGKADLVITTQIDALDRHSLRRKHRGLKSEMRYVLYANVQMMDVKEDRLFFEGTRITRRAEFRANRGERPRTGREEVIRELARRVVALAFERWPRPEAPARTALTAPAVEAETRAR